jgi:hypothetical protein
VTEDADVVEPPPPLERLELQLDAAASQKAKVSQVAKDIAPSYDSGFGDDASFL